jgi:RNA polymerase sigma-70 factor (ECF subfamily)
LLQEKRVLESALLVVRWQRGDRSAFDGLVKLWEQSLFYYLRRLAGSEASALEMLQETWLKLLQSLKSLRDPHAFPSFLYRTARNSAISRLRRPEFLQSDADVHEICDDAPADSIAASYSPADVHHALEQLPLLQREALTLFFLKELSLEEMAVLLGVPVGTVKSRLHYAKHAIREILLQGETDDAPIRRIS